MHLQKHSWHVRWFLLWNRCWAEFTDGRGAVINDRTNLCVYFWVSIGAPVFIGITHALVIGLAFYTAVIYGVTHLTWIGFLIEVAVLVVIAALIWGSIIFFSWVGRILDRRILASESKKKSKPKREGPSWLGLVWAYAIAIKQRACPIIELED